MPEKQAKWTGECAAPSSPHNIWDYSLAWDIKAAFVILLDYNSVYAVKNACDLNGVLCNVDMQRVNICGLCVWVFEIWSIFMRNSHSLELFASKTKRGWLKMLNSIFISDIIKSDKKIWYLQLNEMKISQ